MRQRGDLKKERKKEKEKEKEKKGKKQSSQISRAGVRSTKGRKLREQGLDIFHW